VVDLAHDGFRQAGEMLEQLFLSFGGPGSGAGGGGLSIAQQIVREHGGEIRMRTEPDWPCVFTFTLPIPENEDRRRPGRDRRGVRIDRRARPETASGTGAP
jgi:nitrogen-specific signal transduction histidine kinase